MLTGRFVTGLLLGAVVSFTIRFPDKIGRVVDYLSRVVGGVIGK